MTAGRDPTVAFPFNDLQEYANHPMYSLPLVWKERARRRGTLRIDDAWDGSGMMNCRTPVIRGTCIREVTLK